MITIITSQDQEFKLTNTVMQTCFTTFESMIEQTPLDVQVKTTKDIITSMERTPDHEKEEERQTDV